ncbi:hypothetical protein HYV12_01520 [Candidatus Dojkabacteria bacterium]|nr:hypothetical protein [Candidatus Dojkabacteria bacterium]
MDDNSKKILFKVLNKPKDIDGQGRRSFFIKIGNALLLVLSLFLMYNIAKSADLTVKKIAILKQAEVEVDGLRLKNISLILSREEVETADYIETESRDRLNLAKKDETVFVIPDESISIGSEEVDRILATKESETPDPVYVQWAKFLTGYN